MSGSFWLLDGCLELLPFLIVPLSFFLTTLVRSSTPSLGLANYYRSVSSLFSGYRKTCLFESRIFF